MDGVAVGEQLDHLESGGIVWATRWDASQMQRRASYCERKDDLLRAESIFRGKGINISTEGKIHLGVPLGMMHLAIIHLS